MLSSKRNIIIAGVVALAAIIIAVVAVVVLIITRNHGIYKRCHEHSHLIQEAYISSCPNMVLAGHCEIRRDISTDIYLTFTADKYYNDTKLEIWDPKHIVYASSNCGLRIECPGKAGEEQKLVRSVGRKSFDVGEYNVRFYIYASDAADSTLYCVELPVKVI